MPLPPDEAERRLWIEAYLAGATAAWQDRARLVRGVLDMTPRDSRLVLVAALRALYLDDLATSATPTLQESDASADYERRKQGLG
jgi:hypothetical protein